jgi:CrcB protein
MPPTLATYLAVMAGGALGSAARLWMSGALAARWGETFPVGTLAVNVAGCLLIGLFTGATGPDSPLMVPPLARQFASIGVLGGFTTFSSFGLQTVNLAADGEWLYAFLYVILSVALCLASAWIGIALATSLTQR